MVESISQYLLRQRQQSEQNSIGAAGIVLDSVAGQNPDQVAGDLNLARDFSRTTGGPVPPQPFVSEYRDVLQQAVERERNKQLMSGTRILPEWLRDPQNAALGRDNLENLSWWDRVGRSFTFGDMTARTQGPEFARDASAAVERSMFGEAYGEAGNWFDNTFLMGPDGNPNILGLIANNMRQSASEADGVPRQLVGGAVVTQDERAEAMLARDLGPVFAAAQTWLTQAEQMGFEPTRLGDVRNPATVASFIAENIAMSLPQMAAAISAGGFSPLIQMTLLGGEANNELAERTDLSVDQRVAVASGAGLAMSALDYFGLSRVFGGIPAGQFASEALEGTLVNRLMQNGFSQAAGRLIQAGVAEGATEMLQEGIVMGVTAMSGGEYTSDEVTERLIEAFAAGGAAGAGLRGGAEAVGGVGQIAQSLEQRVTQAQDAENRQTFFNELSGQAQSSTLRDRMPEAFRDFVERATADGPVENVFVPAQDFVEYFQGQGIDPNTIIDALDGVTRDDLGTALVAGGDLRIPTATYAARIAGSEHDAFLMENMRFDPNEMTAREAREFNARAREAMEEAYNLAEEVRREQESLRSFEQEIYDTMVERLRIAGRSTDVATTEALLYPAFYRVMAERSGLTTEEFMRAYPLPQVRGDLPEGMQARDVSELNRTLAEARMRRQAGLERRGPSLLEFIAERGGINDPGGELRARDAETVKRGRKNLRLARGGVVAGMQNMFGVDSRYSVDTVAQAAIEAGYLSDYPEVQEYLNAMREGRQTPDLTRALWDAIDRELRGENQYVPNPDADARAETDAALDSIEEYLNQIGVTLDDDDATIRQAIEADQAGRQYGQGSTTQAEVDALVKSLEAEFNLRSLSMFLTGQGDLKLNMIAVQRDQLGQGTGSKVMQRIVDFADQRGLRVTLTPGLPDDGFGTTSRARLVSFYKRFGFVENKGRKKDFSISDMMYRDPQGGRSYQQSAPATETEAFKRWFGDSKVVDDQGKPLVVYHGTGADVGQDFAFDPAFIGSTGSAEGYGFYFTNDKSTAEGYQHRDGGNVVEAYLSIQKPMPVGQKGFSVSQVGKIIDKIIDAEISQGDADDYKDTFISNYVNTYSMSRASAVREVARIIGDSGDSAVDQIAELGNTSGDKVAVHAAVRDVLGYDGIVSDGYGGRGEAGGTIYVSWFPEQIKSTENRGTFDPNDPRLLFQGPDARGPRGSIQFPGEGVGNGDTIIRLFQSADLSTMVHESGHYFLTVLRDLGARGEPDAQRDFDTVREWWRSNADAVAKDAMRVMPDVKVTADDVIRALDEGSTGDVMLDGAIDVGMQEQFARGFETYLMEGKAPSIELRSAFEKFRAWLISIYQRLAGLDVNLSPEIRRVFDRMLASDQEIEQAQITAGEGGPVFATAEQMGLTDDEYASFLRLRDQAQDEAKARLLREVMAPIKREQEKWFKEERAKTRDEVARNVNAMPVYRAIEWMGNRRWLGENQPETMPDTRLSKDILVQRYGEGVLSTLNANRGRQTIYTVEGGVDPDDAAGWFGFDSGDAMVRAIERAQKRTEAIEAETDRVMRERHGDALNDGAIEREALDAVHTDKRGQWMAAELKAVIDVAGRGNMLTAKEARETARRTMAGMKVRDAMASNRYLAAERKAGEEAARLGAMLAREAVWMQNARRRVASKARAVIREEGTPDAVAAQVDQANRSTANYNETVDRFIAAKRRQLLNHALYMESRNVADEVAKAERFVTGLTKKSKRERIAGAGRREGAQIDYLGAIDEILERYDFRKLSGAAEQRRAGLNDFVAAMTAAGRENELSIPEYVLSEAARRPYKTLPVEELRGVIGSLRNLEHVALRWNDLIDAQQTREFEAVVSDITAAFDANLPKRPPGRVSSGAEGRRNTVRQFLDLVLNAGTILREIDGFEDLGAAYRNIKSPIDDAMNRLTLRREKAAADLENLYAVYSKDERRRMAVREHMPELGYALSKWERIAIALNTGNEGNYQRLTDKNVRGSLSEAQVRAVLGTLDARDADFIQSVWDYVGSFRDDIAARERRTTGVEPDWVEGQPVEIAGKTLRGGYYPLKYDPRLSSLARDDQAQDIAQSLQAGRFGKAQTKNGHLKERAQSSGRDIELDMSVLHRHVQQVVYDLELSEPVANAWRVLHDGRVRNAFIEAGKQPDFDALESWLLDVGEGEIRSGDLVGRGARMMKSNFTAAKLAFNLSTVAVQLTGVPQSMVVVGKRNFALGVQDMFRSGALDDVMAKSIFMRQRQTTFNKDIFDFYNDPKMGPSASRWGDFKQNVMGPLSFWLMTKVQYYAVDVPTWFAGYRQGMKKFGNDEAQAIAHADAVVKRTQASGMFSDRSAVERGSTSTSKRQSDFIRLFTALGSYMFAKFNVAYERTARAQTVIRQEGVSVRSVQEALSWALDMAFLFTIEAVLYAAIKGRLPDEDDEDENWATFLAKETGFSFLSTIPFVRDFASNLQGFEGGGAYGAITKEVGAPFLQIAQGEVDRAMVKSIINGAGLATGLPSTQINRAVDAFWRENIDQQDVSPFEYLLGKMGK